jgi:hypothetical protein
MSEKIDTDAPKPKGIVWSEVDLAKELDLGYPRLRSIEPTKTQDSLASSLPYLVQAAREAREEDNMMSRLLGEPPKPLPRWHLVWFHYRKWKIFPWVTKY